MEIQVPRKINVSREFLIIVGVVIALGLSFYGGTRYEKSHLHQPVATTTTSTNGSGGLGGGFGGSGGGGRGFGGARRSVRGSVTAVSATSITVLNSTTNASATYSITSSTMVTSGGQTAAASDIKVGDSVLIVPDTTTTTQADRILDITSASGASTPPAPVSNNSI